MHRSILRSCHLLWGRRFGPGPYHWSAVPCSLPALSWSPAACRVGNSSRENGDSWFDPFPPTGMEREPFSTFWWRIIFKTHTHTHTILTIPLYSMCNTGLCPGPCPYGLGWSWGQSLASTPTLHDLWAIWFTINIVFFSAEVDVSTSGAGGVFGRVGAGVGEAADCCDSGCGADNASVLCEVRDSVL